MKRAFARFPRARKGMAAVEFALIAPVFFTLTFALAEVTLIGFAQTSLDFAVNDTGRRIRTGQVQNDGVSSGELLAEMCDTMNWVLASGCEGQLYLDVKRYESFVDVQNGNPIQDGAFSDAGFAFMPGAPSDIVMVRAYYRWRILTPFFGYIFANLGDSERLLASTMLFRNEPYTED